MGNYYIGYIGARRRSELSEFIFGIFQIFHQFSAPNYGISRLIRSFNFANIPHILTDIYVIKSTWSFKVFIFGKWVIGEILARFYSSLGKWHYINSKICSLNFINLSLRLSDIFGIKSVIGIGDHIFEY